MKVIGIIVLLALLVWLKRKFDPRNDAFRTRPRYGWKFEKAKVIYISEWKEKKKKEQEQNERKTS